MKRPKRLLALASGGGHWIQLMRLRPAFDGFEVAYVTMFQGYAALVPGCRLHVVPEASRIDWQGFLPAAWRALVIMMKERPHAIVTTGAAPMLGFLLLGRLMGARTLWIDSIANPERLSTSGRIAKHIAHRVVTQWPEVASREGVEYWGSVL